MSDTDLTLPGEALLLTLTQLALGLAAFGGLVALFRHRSQSWRRQDLMGIRLILELAIAAVFLAQLPSVLFLASSSAALAVRWSSLALALFLAVFYLRETLTVRRETRARSAPRHPGIFRVAGILMGVMVLLLVVNGMSWLNLAPYAAGVSFLLACAAMQFFTLVYEPLGGRMSVRTNPPEEERVEAEAPSAERSAPLRLEVLSRLATPPSRWPPVLFVHGGFHAAWCWSEHFLPYFAERGLDAHALSLRGHGGSAGHEGIDRWGLDDYVEDVWQVCQGLSRVPVLVGHSTGAVVVQRYVASRAAAGIVLLAPTPPSPMIWAKLRWTVRHPRAAARVLATRDMNAGLPAFRDLFFSRAMDEVDVRRYMSLLQRESNRLLQEATRPQAPSPAGPRVPALVLASERDRVPPRVYRELAATWAAELRVLPLAHDAMLDPGWRMVADQVIEWIRGGFVDARTPSAPSALPELSE